MQKKHMILFVKVALTGLLAWLLLSSLDWNAVYEHLTLISPENLVVPVLLLAVQAAILAVRWWYIIPLFGKKLPYRSILRFTAESLFFNQTLPSSIGGDAIKVWRSHRSGLSRSEAINAVLLDRINGLVTLIFIGILGLPFLFSLISDWKIRFALLNVIIVSATMFILLLALDLLPGDLRRIKIVGLLTNLSSGTRSMLKQWRTHFLPVFGFSIIIHLISISVILLLANNIYSEANPIEMAQLIPWVLIAMAVPISIAGWGVREGVMVVAFGLIGIPKEAALAISIYFGLLLMFIGLVGGFFWLYRSDRRPLSQQASTDNQSPI